MSRNFEAPLRFLSTPGIAVFDGDHKIHLVTDLEHTTLHLKDDVSQGDIDLCVNMLKSEIDAGKDIDEVMKSLTLFHKLCVGSCIMGDIKPGVLWDWNEEEDRRDRWQDRVSWEEWCSPEYIASEYYNRENQRKAKKRG